MIYLTAIGLTPGGSSTVHIYTQTIHEQQNGHKTIHRTTQLIHGTTQLKKSDNEKCVFHEHERDYVLLQTILFKFYLTCIISISVSSETWCVLPFRHKHKVF